MFTACRRTYQPKWHRTFRIWNSSCNILLASHCGATVVLARDLNCCLLKLTAYSPGQRLTRLLETHDLRVANSERPTYRSAKSLLDTVTTSRPDLVLRDGVTRYHYGTPHDFPLV